LRSWRFTTTLGGKQMAGTHQEDQRNRQETIDFPMNYGVVPAIFPLPIRWHRKGLGVVELDAIQLALDISRLASGVSKRGTCKGLKLCFGGPSILVDRNIPK
jgi:hypothetical protein